MNRPPRFLLSSFRALLLLIAVSCLGSCKANETEPDGNPKTAPSATREEPDDKPSPQKGGEIAAPSDVAAAPSDAQKTASGLASKVLKKGTGKEHPTAEDKVRVHYTGWTKDGTMFDSSEVRKQPASFALNQVIKGWTEGVQLMVVGERRRFWIPGDLAYGETPRRPGAPSGQLTFDVELLDIIVPPKAPKDVASPPATAQKTASGLVYKILQEGKGPRPDETSRVTVHYTGWTQDGKMFDSSIVRERPATFSVRGVIKGWTEGLQLMNEGAKARFWIPSDLAYGEKPARRGAPSGQLTFDVELIKVQPGPKARQAPQPAPTSAPEPKSADTNQADE